MHATQFPLGCSPPKLLTDLHQNFTRYSGISGAIKSCICPALSYSVSECQIDECAEVAIFSQLVAMATSLEISEK